MLQYKKRKHSSLGQRQWL